MENYSCLIMSHWKTVVKVKLGVQASLVMKKGTIHVGSQMQTNLKYFKNENT